MLQLGILFISKPFAALWTQSQRGKFDSLFLPRVQHPLGKSFPLSFMQQEGEEGIRGQEGQELRGAPESVRIVDVN